MSIEQVALSEGLEPDIVAELVLDAPRTSRGIPPEIIEEKPRKSPGRKRTYIDYKKVEELTRQHLTLKEIALRLEIGYKTFHSRISQDRPDLKKRNLK